MAMLSGSRPHPEVLYYHTAADALKMAVRETDEFRRKQMVVTSLVFSVLCLEVFINQQYARLLPDESLKSRGLKKKWQDLPGLLRCDTSFEESNEPFRTFSDMITTRNDRLVHFKLDSEILNANSTPTREYFGDLVGNLSLAASYLDCVQALIDKLSTLTKGDTPKADFISNQRWVSYVSNTARAVYETTGPKPLE
jgi:hypothetical protein